MRDPVVKMSLMATVRRRPQRLQGCLLCMCVLAHGNSRYGEGLAKYLLTRSTVGSAATHREGMHHSVQLGKAW